ncbi:MAG: RyR domain-containing protein [Thermoproteota archaeon]
MLEISKEELEMLAKALHDRWMEEKLRQGWTYGPVKNIEKKTHPDLIPYEDLPEDKKELDRMYIRDFLKILDNAGFVLQEGQAYELSKEDIEELAKASHELWLKKASPDHEYYKPYEELPEPAKELNRNTVRFLVELFQSKGYGIAKALTINIWNSM